MKTFFAVTFFGILMYSFDQVSPQQCQRYTTMATFEPSNFFIGAWVVTHAKSGSQLITCRTYMTGLNRNTITFNGDGYYGDGETATYYQVRCTGNKNNGKNGKFSLSCTRQKPSMTGTSTKNSQIGFSLELSIIDTDYAQYAIVQTCSTYPTLGVTKDNILVLHRSKDALKPNIEAIFQQKLGSSLSTYITRQKGTECRVA